MMQLMTKDSNYASLPALHPEIPTEKRSLKHATTSGYSGFVAKDGIHGTGICNDLKLYPNQTHGERGIIGVWAAIDWQICNLHNNIYIINHTYNI